MYCMWFLFCFGTVMSVLIVGMVVVYFCGFKPWMRRFDRLILKGKAEENETNNAIINPDIMLYIFMYLPYYVLKFFDTYSVTNLLGIFNRAIYSLLGPLRRVKARK
ncbi:uncharacterized protein LOC124359096 isoform X3 [Homalodisca vitripennis]|uniref:uncharacterized protein LOC124359096 isoform X3 n=2 Tax=Homalodisca vitripennis TaxID=197043 RepID=UPI001EE9EF68|nr:uncharacterized protein LOC124359096 isoform X3 [Homalodisca vitripennis]XP_046667494.1 uncharacterized protein LOC124359096 isoform X3 [Homalodisca vitripennis]